MKPSKINTHAERQDSQVYESNTLEITARDKTKQKGKGGMEGEGRRQPRLRTLGKLLAPGARTWEGEEGGSKRPTLLPR
jgi:hypothetical protein